MCAKESVGGGAVLQHTNTEPGQGKQTAAVTNRRHTGGEESEESESRGTLKEVSQ